jgi:hypothetical protein
MSVISDNDLRTHGVAAIEAALVHATEAFISGRKQNRFVVMSIEQFQYLRNCELETALARSREDLIEGRFVISSPGQHLDRLKERTGF